jgi:hypothetical protein
MVAVTEVRAAVTEVRAAVTEVRAAVTEVRDAVTGTRRPPRHHTLTDAPPRHTWRHLVLCVCARVCVRAWLLLYPDVGARRTSLRTVSE